MIRRAFATRETPVADTPAATPRRKQAPATDDAQDRLGAQGAYAARSGVRMDPWTEIALLVSRMLKSGGQATAPPGPAPLARPPEREPETEPEVETAGVPAQAAAPLVPGPVPAAQPPLTAERRALEGEVERPRPPEIEVPAFPEAEGGAIEAPDVPTGGAAAPAAAPAPTALPTAAAPAADSKAAGESHKAIVRRWQGGVSAAGGGLPRPKVEVPAGAKAELAGAAKDSKSRNEKVRGKLPEEAVKNVPDAPEVEEAPAPPPSNPVPEHTARVLALSDKRLPDQAAPALVKSPERDVENGVKVGGNLPRLGEVPVASDLFQILTAPGARELAQLPEGEVGPDGKETPEAKRVREALEQLSGTGQATERRGRGPPVISPDKGPVPMKPLPEHLQAPVGQVVARLLAEADDAAAKVLDTLRASAYPGGVLKQNFPDIGDDMAGDVKTVMDTELREIAAAANVSAEDLEGMVSQRRQELEAGTKAAAEEVAKEGAEAAEATAEEGQKTADAVDGAAQLAEEETLRRQEAAGGSADPQVINRRRDLTVKWIKDHVTTQITNYQEAGDKRVGELKSFQRSQGAAYQALVQREQFVVLTPQPPERAARDVNDKAREKKLADIAVEIRSWGDERTKAMGEDFRLKIAAAEKATKDNRSAIESAGSAGVEAARAWAEDKILEGESWWTRFIARIKRWLSEADSINEEWRVRRTRENRDAVAIDIQVVENARERMKAGLTQEQILADQTMSAGEKAILQQYFALGPGAHPLDFAAVRLRQNLAMEQLPRAREIFERELLGTSVGGGDYATAEKLNAVVRSVSGGFDGAKIAQTVHGAMDQIGTEEDTIFSALNGLTALGGKTVRAFYRAIFNSDLDADLEDEMSGDELGKAQAQIEGKQSEADAIGLHDAIAGLGTDEAAIMKTLRNKSPAELEAIKAAYFAKYGESLDDALKGDLDEGNEIDQADALMRGDTATADAIALDEAMRGGFLGLGTSEEEIEGVYEQVRSEVAARARAENWSSAQMEAEVRRRLGQIEGKFEERYKDVEEYNAPGLEGETVLRRAYSSELHGAEKDLAVALQDNDPIAADAARIEIERTGFYASDEKLNKVLKSQYERALEARRLDEGPARNMRVQREVEKWRDEKPQLSEEEISRRRMALERKMESEMADAAQGDSKLAMGELEKLYQDNYTWPMSFVLDWNMSGTDRLAARDMLKQGGRLTALQEVEYATDQTGTDEEALRRRLSTMTWDEIQKLRTDWEARHPGRSFDAMLRGELSGRDESDIMDMVAHGAPESAMEQIAQEKRRVAREKEELTGVLGSAAAGSEEKWMEHQLAQLEELQAPLLRTDWPDTSEGRAQREELQEKVAFRVQRVQDAVQDHRRRIDSYTDAVTTVVGVVVGVVVAVVLGAFTGGAGAAATFAVMAKIALAASLAATVSTMAAKRLIMGGAYGDEAFLTDLAVGGVDALTAVATAGLGSKLLGPMKNLVARTRVGDVASWLGKSGMAQKLAGGAQKMASGAQKFAPELSKKVAGVAGKAVPTRGGLERGAASFLSESFTDAVGAAPSSFVQIALTDSTWQGDPLANFLSGGGMALLQAVAMGRVMGAGMDVGGSVFTTARGKLRMGSDVGRLLEANRIITEGYGRFAQENPGASLADFLAHPTGRKVRAEIETKGLLPTLESVTRAAEAQPAPRKPDGADPAAKPTPRKEAEVRAAALESSIPKGLREGTFVTPDAELPGRTVRVEPLRIGDRIVGVDVRVGPDATPLDIALHAATVHAMQRYRGVLGNALRAIEDVAAKLLGTGLTVGSRGWEARLEMAKLPAIIAARMEGLSGAALPPHLEARIHADIASLQQQLAMHQAILADPKLSAEPGRGFVAAEDDVAKFAAYPRRNPDGSLTELGRIELDQHLDALAQARGRDDPAGAGAAIKAIAGLTGIPEHNVWKITSLPEGERLAVLDRIEAIRIADPVADADYVAGLVAEIAADTGLSRAEILVVARTPEQAPDLNHLLGGDPIARDTGLPTSAAAGPQSGLGNANVQKLIDQLVVQPGVKPGDIATPSELINRIGLGDADAQAALNRNSAAPPGYEVVVFDSARMEASLTGKPTERRTGIIRIGDGTIKISRMPPTTKNPNPPYHFYNEFPPYSQVGNRVLQLEDGALRIWRGPPEPGHPDGKLFQETTVGPRRDRAGHETRAQKSYGEAGMVGPKTERAHAHGAGRGPESPFGILHAPVEVNQALQKRGIEAFLERLRDQSPPGLSWHYVTEVTHQGPTPQHGEARLASIIYRIDVTIKGARVPFAEFEINIDPLPTHKPAGDVKGKDLAHVSPITFRDNPHPVIQSILHELREAADVPLLIQHGLPRGERADAVAAAQHLKAFTPEEVRSAVNLSRGMKSLPPGSGSDFDAIAWRRQLREYFDSEDWAPFVVVDLRDLKLTKRQRETVRRNIARLPDKDARRIVLLE